VIIERVQVNRGASNWWCFKLLISYRAFFLEFLDRTISKHNFVFLEMALILSIFYGQLFEIGRTAELGMSLPGQLGGNSPRT
jgi:hypothetical protein